MLYKEFDKHQHLTTTRVADDKLLNARVDGVLIKEAARLHKLQAKVEQENKVKKPCT